MRARDRSDSRVSQNDSVLSLKRCDARRPHTTGKPPLMKIGPGESIEGMSRRLRCFGSIHSGLARADSAVTAGALADAGRSDTASIPPDESTAAGAGSASGGGGNARGGSRSSGHASHDTKTGRAGVSPNSIIGSRPASIHSRSLSKASAGDRQKMQTSMSGRGSSCNRSRSSSACNSRTRGSVGFIARASLRTGPEPAAVHAVAPLCCRCAACRWPSVPMRPFVPASRR